MLHHSQVSAAHAFFLAEKQVDPLVADAKAVDAPPIVAEEGRDGRRCDPPRSLFDMAAFQDVLGPAWVETYLSVN